VGAPQAAILSTVEPLLTLVLATVLLGEILALRQWLGGALILTSVLLLQLQGRATTLARTPLPAADDRSPTVAEPPGEAG
jgi:drug/metabolite transporter (DMT)-like permease